MRRGKRRRSDSGIVRREKDEADQEEATAKMPSIWPPQAFDANGLTRNTRISMGKSVDRDGDGTDDVPDVQAQSTSQFNSSSPPRPCGKPERHSGAVRPGGECECNPERAGRPTRVGSTRKFQSDNGHYLIENGVDPTDVADLLEVVARLLRKGALDVDGTQRSHGEAGERTG